MPSNVVNRKTERKALAALYEAARVAGDLDVQVVYDYLPDRLQSQTPVLAVASGGSQRQKQTEEPTNWDVEFDLKVYLFVLFVQDDDSWTVENAQDKLDDLEKAAVDVMADNTTNTGTYLPEESTVEELSDLDGIPYLVEEITVRRGVLT